MGEELRTVYSHIAGSQRRLLMTVLSQRRKVVEVSDRTIRTWYQLYASPSARSSVPPSRVCVKRPAAAGAALKRPAAAAGLQAPVAKRPAAAEAVPAVAPELTQVSNCDGLEAACGERYRLEVSDKGLGLARNEMRSLLLAWGYDASAWSCREWLAKYRLGHGAKDGNAAVFELSREALRRWHFVEKLTPAVLVQKYRDTCGIHSLHSTVVQWLRAPAQALERFSNNEDVHAHPSGEYVLEQLQNGVAAEQVVVALLERYMVESTAQRVLAYRVYREQRGLYWTSQKLEDEHWEFLYGLVSPDKNLARVHRTSGLAFTHVLEARGLFAQTMGLSEELIPIQNFVAFFMQHQWHARLGALYPDARVYKDCVRLDVVNAFRETFRGQVLPDAGFGVVRQGSVEVRNRIAKVACDSRLIVFPKASAEACVVAAYAMSDPLGFHLGTIGSTWYTQGIIGCGLFCFCRVIAIARVGR